MTPKNLRKEFDKKVSTIKKEMKIYTNTILMKNMIQLENGEKVHIPVCDILYPLSVKNRRFYNDVKEHILDVMKKEYEKEEWIVTAKVEGKIGYKTLRLTFQIKNTEAK